MRRQKYLNIFTGGAADLVPLVTSCLNDNPKKRPSVIEISKEIKTVKDVCSQQMVMMGWVPSYGGLRYLVSHYLNNNRFVTEVFSTEQ